VTTKFGQVWCFGNAQWYLVMLNHIMTLGCHLVFIVDTLVKMSLLESQFLQLSLQLGPSSTRQMSFVMNTKNCHDQKIPNTHKDKDKL
jgi:hypothetical protein